MDQRLRTGGIFVYILVNVLYNMDWLCRSEIFKTNSN